MTEVALITVYNAAGELLLGKRSDNSRYTMPGGHLEPGEDPREGAVRELWEETGLRPTSLSYLKRMTNEDGTVLHCFSAYVAGDPQPHGKNDPDQECEKWEWVDVRGGLKAKYYDHLHGPKSAEDGNVLKQIFDLKKAESSDYKHTGLGVAATIKFPNEEAGKNFAAEWERRFDHDLEWEDDGPPDSYYLSEDGTMRLMLTCDADMDRAREIAAELGGKMVPPELTKAEDEVGRMLEHPDATERSIALKLATVTPRHLQTASLDPDPVIHQAAIDHPRFGDAQGMHLMEATTGLDGKPPTAQQLAFMARPDRVRPEHLAALVHALAGSEQRAAMLPAVIGHPAADPGLLRAIYLDLTTPVAERLRILAHPKAPPDVALHALGLGLMAPEARAIATAAVVHPNLPGEAVDTVIRSAADRPQEHVQAIAEAALANRAATPDLIDYLFTQAKLGGQPHVLALVGNLLQGPSANANLIQRGISELPAGVAVNAVGSKVPGALQPQHMDALVAMARGDSNLIGKLQAHPAFGPQHLEQLLHKAEWLAKTVDPAHLKPIASATTPDGAKLVDHTPDLSAHPTSMGPEVEAYRQQVLHSPGKVGLDKSKLGGVSKKRVFHVQVAGHEKPTKMMVKPYHEKIAGWAKKWMAHPHQGWAEMTNQTLFHAAGIGHLHQKVHVVEHDMGPGHEKEPALVVHLQPEHTQVSEYGGRHYDEPTVEKGMNLRKLAIMDFLSNAQDRHVENLLVNDKTQEPLAIDNSRNFQYVAPNRWAARGHGGEDAFGSYVKNSAINTLEALLDDRKAKKGGGPGAYYPMFQDAMKRYAPAFEWWGSVSDGVKKAFHDRLGQVKDPDVRDHLRRNFDARASWLDERAKFGLENYGERWYNDTVPMYKPGEMTDEEAADPEFSAAHRQRQAEKSAAAKEARRQKVKARNDYKLWLDSKPKYPHHLGDLSLAERDKHPDWQKYRAESDKWFARRPAEAA